MIKFYKATHEQLSTVIANCKNQQDRVTEKIIFQGEDSDGNKIVEKQIINFDLNSPEVTVKMLAL